MPNIRVIDTQMGDQSGLTAAFLVEAERPALIETGPGRSVRHVLAALRAAGVGPRDLAYIVVTHVHLDHAGAAGDLAAAFPLSTVVAHPAGARHLADPTRLVASATQVHGPLMDTVYGSMLPVPVGRIVAADDASRLDLGNRTLTLHYTPGHAKHHLAVLDDAGGTLFPGDAAGLWVEPMRRPRPATPPPDFDADDALASLRRMRSLGANRLLLTHFGPVDEPADWLDQACEQLLAWCAVARNSASSGVPEVLERELLAAFADAEGMAAATPGRFDLFGGYAANAAGLSHWAVTAQGV